MKRYEIFPGVNLTVIYSDKFKTDRLTATFAVPLKKETAHLAALLPSVLRRGTVSLPNMLEIGRRLDYLYGTILGTVLQRKGENQIFGFRAIFLRDSLVPNGEGLFKGVLSMLAEMLYRPALENGCFISEYVESEKKNRVDAIRAIINNKNEYALRRLLENMCEGEPLSVCELGTEENVNGITPQSLYEFYREVVDCAPMELYYTGMTDGDTVAEQVRQALSERDSSALALSPAVVKKSVSSVKNITEKMPVNQGKLVLGFRTGGSLYEGNAHIFALMNAVFGGGVTSKLFMNVREKMSLCYYCSSFFMKEKGIICVNSGINVENFTKTKDEILHQLELVKQGEITDDEISDAKRAIENSLSELYDDAGALEDWYHTYALSGVKMLSPTEYADMVKKVSKSEVIAAANTVTLDTIYFLEGTIKDEQGGDEE